MSGWWKTALAGSVLGLGLTLAATSNALAQDAISASCTVGGLTAGCTSGWYTNAVTVVWQATPPPTSTSGCELGIAYSYPGDRSSSLSCTATWSDGTQDTYSFPFHVEVSTPSVTATPSRPPDANGWYNHPVGISFNGSAFSLIAWCSVASETYTGPATPGTSVGSTCTDNAGKSASASVAIRYDATPPALSLTVVPGDRSATLRWRATTDLAPLTSLRVVRRPGRRGAAASVLAPTSGAGSYSDGGLRNRRAYRYTVTATDQAGNVTVRSVVVRPGPRLLTPASGARVRTPPLLSWTAIPKATYYNVQVFRGGKILSAWPKRAHLKMARSWGFGGHRFRLRRGRYRWYVWPGFGRRSAARYGAQVGSGTFVVS